MKLPWFITECINRVNQDLIFIRASSLTYQTFLAIVPLLAVMFGIAKGFGIEQSLETFLRLEFSDHQEVLDYLLRFSQTTLQEARGGIVAGTGIAVLLFTAMRLFSSVEETFNIMWGIQRPRRYIHKAISYLAIIVLCPLLLVVAGSFTIFLSTSISTLSEKIFFSYFGKLFVFGVSCIPVLTLTVLFSVLLYVIPSTRLSIRSSLFSGCIAAILFQMVQMWYIQLQLSLTKMGAIYGSFVALPLFLAWLWMSWFIFLFSGELSIIFEERLWRFKKSTGDINPKICMVAILSTISENYQKGFQTDIKELQRRLSIPLKTLYISLECLKDKKLIYEGINDDSSSLTFLPSISTFSYRITDLFFDISDEETSTKNSPEITAAYEKLFAVKKIIDTEEVAKFSPKSIS